MEISDNSTEKLIVKGIANHASKAYEFSHFFPYSNLVKSLQPFKKKGKFILPKPFSYDDVSTYVSDLKFEDEDQEDKGLDIENEAQVDPDQDPTLAPNPRTKWAPKFIEAAQNMDGDSSNKMRTMSQFQDESLVLCHANSLLPYRCYELTARYYIMERFDQQFCKVACYDSPKKAVINKEYESLKNNETMDHVSLP